jgi:hypothetical protein
MPAHPGIRIARQSGVQLGEARTLAGRLEGNLGSLAGKLI